MSIHHKNQREMGLFYPIVFPFYDRDAWSRLWWVAALSYIPFINLLLLSGWKIELIRRVAMDEEQLLPNAKLGQFLKDGFYLGLVKIAYFVIPLLLLSVTGTGTFYLLFSLLSGEMDWQDALGRWLIGLGIDGCWTLIALMTYAVGKIKYAATGNIGEFFKFAHLLQLGFKNITFFVKLFLGHILLLAVLAILGELLILSAIGIMVLPIFTLLVYYWVSGYELGELAPQVLSPRERNWLEAHWGEEDLF